MAKILIFEKKKYVWNKGMWSAPNNLTTNTALSQKLTEIAIKNGILSKEDLSPNNFSLDAVEITKTEKK